MARRTPSSLDTLFVLRNRSILGINGAMPTKGSQPTNAQAPNAHEETLTVKVFGGLRQRLGGSGSVRVPIPSPPTLSGLLADLAKTHADLVADLRSGLDDGYLNILVNGRNVRFLAGFDTEVKAGDSVAFLPPVGGG